MNTKINTINSEHLTIRFLVPGLTGGRYMKIELKKGIRHSNFSPRYSLNLSNHSNKRLVCEWLYYISYKYIQQAQNIGLTAYSRTGQILGL